MLLKNTCQIRRYTSTAAAAVLTACMLFGCTRADIASSSPGASGEGGSVGHSTVAGAVSDSTLAGAGAGQGSKNAPQQAGEAALQQTGKNAPQQSGTVQNIKPSEPGAKSSASSASAADETQQSSKSVQNVSGTTTAAETGAARRESETSGQAQADTAAGDAAAVPAPVVSGNAAQPAADAFVGEYRKEGGGEIVTIEAAGEGKIRFQFMTGGIGALAQVNGNTALYSGDDGYSVTFYVSQDVLAVQVSGEGGEASPMNGTYYRDGSGAAAQVLVSEDAGKDAGGAGKEAGGTGNDAGGARKDAGGAGYDAGDAGNDAGDDDVEEADDDAEADDEDDDDGFINADS